jgi:hypothetical protein
VETAPSCKKGSISPTFKVLDATGAPIITIDECTGKLTVAHPERMDESAREFWRAVRKTWAEEAPHG